MYHLDEAEQAIDRDRMIDLVKTQPSQYQLTLYSIIFLCANKPKKTAGADVELKYQIWNYLKKINDEGKTIFLTTHYMEEAEKLSKTVIIIDRGKIIHAGDKRSLLKDHSLEQRFLELIRKETSA